MGIMGQYRNGTYSVTMLDDGTKIRYSKDDVFEGEFAESIDLKITNRCFGNGSGLCSMCHENSSPDGRHGDIMNLEFIDTLHPYTEVAVGGGNALLHPDLIPFLEKLKKLKVIANVTVSQHDFMDKTDFLKSLMDNKLIYGLGVSLDKADDKFVEAARQFPNLVVHIINGLTPMWKLKKLAGNDLKILILGYKKFRRGYDLYNEIGDNIEFMESELYEALPRIVDEGWFDCVSFDNLAIEQLEPQRLMSEDEWERMFMGNDGSHTFYIDAVEKQFGRNSTSVERWPLKDDASDMFKVVKGAVR